MVMNMFIRRQASLYLHDNVPILQEETVDDVSSVSSDTVRGEPVGQRSEVNGRDAMLELIDHKVSAEDEKDHHDSDDEQRVELQLHGTEEQMETLQDLSELLYTRGRLQELGCTFTDLGELTTYGNPPNLKESEQLLRLGPVYDEQWASFFRPPENPFPNDDPKLWSDLRTLKRVLINEGVAFGILHRRLTWGGGSNKIVRLCAAYDDLQKLWSASLALIRIPTTVNERTEDELDETVDDSGCFMDGKPDSDVTDDQSDVQRGLNRRSGVPRNLGWRYSDDIDPTAATRYGDSPSVDDYAELGEDVEAAVAVSFSPANYESVQCSTPVQVEKSRQSAPPTTIGTFLNSSRTRHVLSPLQDVTRHSMIRREELMADPRGDGMDSLGMDGRIIAAMVSAPTMEEMSQAQSAKKKGLKSWWHGVVGRRTSAVPYQQVQIRGGWW